MKMAEIAEELIFRSRRIIAVRLIARFIGVDDARDKRMADDVGGGEPRDGDAFDALNERERVGKARRSRPSAGRFASDRR